MNLHQWVLADESGINEDARYCLVTGYIGTPKQWDTLAVSWDAEVKKQGLDSFHAWQFFDYDKSGHRLGLYKGWTDSRARSFIAHLCKIINKRNLRPIGGAVEWEAFNRLTKGERQHLTGGAYNVRRGKFMRSGAPSKPYYLALNYLVREAIESSADGSILNFLLDRQHQMMPRALEMMQDIAGVLERQPKSILGGRKFGIIGYQNSAHWPGLQAADLHVHSWYAYLQRGIENMSSDRIFAMNELTTKRRSIKLIDADFIELAFDTEVTPEIRERMKQL